MRGQQSLWLNLGGFHYPRRFAALTTALTAGSESSAAAYVSLQSKDGRTVWGCGVDANIELAGLKALVSAANRLG